MSRSLFDSSSGSKGGGCQVGADCDCKEATARLAGRLAAVTAAAVAAAATLTPEQLDMRAAAAAFAVARRLFLDARLQTVVTLQAEAMQMFELLSKINRLSFGGYNHNILNITMSETDLCCCFSCSI